MRLKMSEVVLDIAQMNQAELQTVIKAINRRNKQLIATAAAIIADTLCVGDAVWFDAKSRGVIRGKVKKINTKTVKVTADNGVEWTVHATLVRKMTKVVA